MAEFTNFFAPSVGNPDLYRQNWNGIADGTTYLGDQMRKKEASQLLSQGDISGSIAASRDPNFGLHARGLELSQSADKRAQQGFDLTQQSEIAKRFGSIVEQIGQQAKTDPVGAGKRMDALKAHPQFAPLARAMPGGDIDMQSQYVLGAAQGYIGQGERMKMAAQAQQITQHYDHAILQAETDLYHTSQAEGLGVLSKDQAAQQRQSIAERRQRIEQQRAAIMQQYGIAAPPGSPGAPQRAGVTSTSAPQPGYSAPAANGAGQYAGAPDPQAGYAPGAVASQPLPPPASATGATVGQTLFPGTQVGQVPSGFDQQPSYGQTPMPPVSAQGGARPDAQQPQPQQQLGASGIQPGQSRIVGGQAPPDMTALQAVRASLPPQLQAAFDVEAMTAIKSGNYDGLGKMLQKYQSPQSLAADEFGKKQGGVWSDIYNGALHGEGTARQMEVVLGQFERAMNAVGPRGVSTGLLADKQVEAANFLQSLGVDPKSIGITKANLSQLEVLQALGSQMTASMSKALQAGEGGKGGPAARVTDADIRLFSTTEPNISKSPQGNRLMLAVLRERNQLQFSLTEAAQTAQDLNPHDPIAAQKAYHKLQQQAYSAYEQKRDALVDQAGFGQKGQDGPPVDARSSVITLGRELKVPQSDMANALKAIQDGAPADQVMTMMRQRHSPAR